jgi:hypothetical protein
VRWIDEVLAVSQWPAREAGTDVGPLTARNNRTGAIGAPVAVVRSGTAGGDYRARDRGL